MTGISIIIPSKNDSTLAKKLISQLYLKISKEDEIILAEVDSIPKINISQVKVIKGVNGRAQCLNAGAKQAKNPLLWFVHADSDISNIDLEKIRNLGKTHWGNFTINFATKNPYFRFIEWNSNRRARRGMVFGDQSMFMPKSLYHKVKKFNPSSFYEDVDISQKLIKIQKNKMLSDIIISSPRRFEQHGIIFTHAIMGLIMLTYYLHMKKISKNLYKLINQKKL